MRVLVVEDERGLAQMIAQAIEESGLAADVAFDGEEGLRLASEYAYDAIVLDLLLPKRHGLSVLREIRRAGRDVPILVLSALDQVEERIDGLDRGADDYVTKPFALSELLARLRAVLRRANARAGVAGALVTAGDLEVDLAAHVVRRNGRTIRLSPREYALLVMFLQHRGEALSRSEIGTHVVDREFEVTSNLIDVSIHGLRAKLGDPPLIQTVRGFGYRFDAPACP